MDDLLFLHVEEAIKRVRQTLGTQELIALMIWERARCQYVHIKALEEWKEQLQAGLDKIYDDTFPESQLITSVLTEEAFLTQTVHQMIHHQLLTPDGPYYTLNNDAKAMRDKQNPTEFRRMEDQFMTLRHRKQQLMVENSKHKQSIDHLKTSLIALEEQLSKRSRIADVKRSSARGTRKIDAIQARVSSIRRQINTTQTILESREEELSMLYKNNREKLKNMIEKFRKLDKQRLQLIIDQCQEYLKRMKINTAIKNGCRFPNKLEETIQSLADANIEEIIEEGWRKVENNARFRKTGQMLGSKVNFTTSNTKGRGKDTSKDSFILRGISDLSAYGDSSFKEYDENDERTCESRMDFYGAPKTSSSDDLVRQKPLRVTKVPSQCSGSSSGSKIETIYLSESSEMHPRLPPPFPVRPFCVSDEESEHERKKHVEESSSFLSGDIMDTIYEMENIHEGQNETRKENSCRDFDTDIRGLRNIQVVAKSSYKATRKGELSIKKGQIIKQKMGEDENGFSYGWIRGNKLSPKQYGWYPSDIVGRIS